MSMPYEKGNIDGGPFCLQWVVIIFQVNIHVWDSLANSIANYYNAHSNYDKTIDVMSFETNTSHIHYEPLVRKNCSQECTLHSN
jgi:hypothetical protein